MEPGWEREIQVYKVKENTGEKRESEQNQN